MRTLKEASTDVFYLINAGLCSEEIDPNIQDYRSIVEVSPAKFELTATTGEVFVLEMHKKDGYNV